MKVLITGSNGQLGQVLNQFKPSNIQILNTNKSTFDLTNKLQISEYILYHKPDWVINSGAYTNVDKSEKESDIVFQTNSFSVEAISQALCQTNGKLLQISTDFVFDGKTNKSYTPYEKTNPIGVYGFSKLKAEEYIKEIIPDPNRGIILRTSWLMGHTGNNFALKMLKLHNEKDLLNVVIDQIGSPTSAISLAKTCWEIVLFSGDWNNYANEQTPIIHLSDLGIASWYDVAMAVGEIGIELGILNKMARVLPIKSCNYPTIAKRPEFSALDSEMARNFLDIKPMHWRKAMLEYLKLVVGQAI